MIYEYEIQYTITDRNGCQHGRTATQFAYNISDALYQTIYLSAREFPESRDFKVTRIGPPQRLIDVASKSTERFVEDALARLTSVVKEARKVK